MVWGGSGTDITEIVSLAKGQSKSITLPNGDYKYSIEVTYTGQGEAPVIRNSEVLFERTQRMQFGIDYTHALRETIYTEESPLVQNGTLEPGVYFGWTLNLQEKNMSKGVSKGGAGRLSGANQRNKPSSHPVPWR